MTRNGKIARLPRLVRNELNRCLDDGQEGPALLAWLNAHPDVVASLARQHAEPITKQNLSEWRLGGYQDWLREQSTHAWLRDLADQYKNLRDELGFVSFADWLSAPLTVALGQCLEHHAARPPADAESTEDFLALARGLSHLRRADHEQQRVRILRARHDEHFAEDDEKNETDEPDEPTGMVPPSFQGD